MLLVLVSGGGGSRFKNRPKLVAADRKLTQGGAVEILDYLKVVHVFIRRSHPSSQALHQTGKAHRGKYSSVGLPDEKLSE